MPEIEYRLEEQKLTPSGIDGVEAKLDFRFPDQFRKFYLAHNGGMPHPNCFEHDGQYWQANEIYALKYGDEGSLFESCYEMIVIGSEASPPVVSSLLSRMQEAIFTVSEPVIPGRVQSAASDTSTPTVQSGRLLNLPMTFIRSLALW